MLVGRAGFTSSKLHFRTRKQRIKRSGKKQVNPMQWGNTRYLSAFSPAESYFYYILNKLTLLI